MKVADLIGSRREVFSIREDSTVLEAARYLREKQVRAVGVVNVSGNVVGVISHSDVSDKVAAENKCPDWERASGIMTRELVTVTEDMSLEEVEFSLIKKALARPAAAKAAGGRRESARRPAGIVHLSAALTSIANNLLALPGRELFVLFAQSFSARVWTSGPSCRHLSFF